MTLEPSTGRRLEAALLLVAFVGCGRPTPPGALVGESAHFRLYVDPDATVPAGLEGMNGLVALETEWADVQTMLRMPDGKITYYLLSQDHVTAACEARNEGACTWEQSLEIDSPTLPNPHELNHAYMYLRKQRRPIPFLAEGIAEAIACEYNGPLNVDDVPWQGIVAELGTSKGVSAQGGAFVRHLIRRFGIEAFLRYYEQSPEERDPARFAANFQAFWNMTVDDFWSAMHGAPGTITEGESKLCPCSLPPLDPSGAVVNDRARAPYWPLPDPGGKTLALSAGGAGALAVLDCAGIHDPLIGQAVLARLGGSEPRYVLAPLVSATLDFYLADTCAGAAPYTVPPPLAFGSDVMIGVSTPASSNAVTVYLNLASSFSAVLRYGLQEICGDCGFDQGSCQPIAPQASPTVQGPFYGRMTLRRSAGLPSDVVWNYFELLGP